MMEILIAALVTGAFFAGYGLLTRNRGYACRCSCGDPERECELLAGDISGCTAPKEVKSI